MYNSVDTALLDCPPFLMTQLIMYKPKSSIDIVDIQPKQWQDDDKINLEYYKFDAPSPFWASFVSHQKRDY